MVVNVKFATLLDWRHSLFHGVERSHQNNGLFYADKAPSDEISKVDQSLVTDTEAFRWRRDFWVRILR